MIDETSLDPESLREIATEHLPEISTHLTGSVQPIQRSLNSSPAAFANPFDKANGSLWDALVTHLLEAIGTSSSRITNGAEMLQQFATDIEARDQQNAQGIDSAAHPDQKEG